MTDDRSANTAETDPGPRPATVPSPCVGVCQIDRETRYCLGCWRKLEEIAHWSRYDDPKRLAVLDMLRERQSSAGVNRRRQTRRRAARGGA